ncbi:MAG: hypothetical protein HY292_23125 [Planctomycetes bacterium]|nr:hypothetical protein [Planctomycetota bacterium]
MIDALQRLLRAVERRGRTVLFLRSGARTFAALAPCAALVSLLFALFGPAFVGTARPLGLAPAITSIAVSFAAALVIGVVESRRPPRGAWIAGADAALALEGRLDAGAAILAGRSTSRFAPLVLADANARTERLRARGAIPPPRIGRALAVGAVAIAIAFTSGLVPPVRAAAPSRGDEIASQPAVQKDPPVRSTPPGRPESQEPPAIPLTRPPTPEPEPPRVEPDPEPPPPRPEPQPQGGNEPDPLGHPPPTREEGLDPKFLEPLIGEGELREKDAFTTEPDAGTRTAKPLTPEELRRLFPEIRKRAEASLPRQAFTDEERRVVMEYMKWVPR